MKRSLPIQCCYLHSLILRNLLMLLLLELYAATTFLKWLLIVGNKLDTGPLSLYMYVKHVKYTNGIPISRGCITYNIMHHSPSTLGRNNNTKQEREHVTRFYMIHKICSPYIKYTTVCNYCSLIYF